MESWFILHFSTFSILLKLICNTIYCYMKAWTLNVVLMNKLEACTMCLCRIILKNFETPYVTNEELWRRIGNERELLHHIKTRTVNYIEHMLRKKKYKIVQLIAN